MLVTVHPPCQIMLPDNNQPMLYIMKCHICLCIILLRINALPNLLLHSGGTGRKEMMVTRTITLGDSVEGSTEETTDNATFVWQPVCVLSLCKQLTHLLNMIAYVKK